MMTTAFHFAAWLWFPFAVFAYWRGARIGLNAKVGQTGAIIGAMFMGTTLSFIAFCVQMAFSVILDARCG